MSLSKESEDDHSMELWTLTLFALGEVERFLQLLWLNADEGCLMYKEKYITTICEAHPIVLSK